jgi:hypothetical protein
MLLSGNAESCFSVKYLPRRHTPAANLLTPAAGGAISTVNVAAVGTISSATVAASFVAPASGQKRKACPSSQPRIVN